MNVIFLDFDGVLKTMHYRKSFDIERRIKILADICKEYDSKVVIEATAKELIDEKTMTSEVEWIQEILNLLKKYDIDCIGRTPTIRRQRNESSYFPVWKEDEILSYLSKHPEIDHYCVIDDDDMPSTTWKNHSDLDKIRDHLVKPCFDNGYNYEEEGLLEKHKEEVGKILKK